MKLINLFFLFLLLIFPVRLFADTFQVKANQMEIVLPSKSCAVRNFAALELQKHLQLISGAAIPIRTMFSGKGYPLYIEKPQTDSLPLKKEEARWKVTPYGAWLYGDDFIETSKNPAVSDLFLKTSRTGSLFAVYSFLEQELKILWTEPGDKGIIYAPAQEFTFTETEGKWTPDRLIQRQIRNGYRSWEKYRKEIVPQIPGPFRLNQAEYEKRRHDSAVWLKRQRMGNSFVFSYGHAFTNWWKLYGKTHPEYFAMQEDGKRHPKDYRDYFVKLCVSNPKVHERIVSNWRKQKSPPKVINVCENDADGYCRCPECRKLDDMTKNKVFGSNLSDRYVWFSNAVLRKAAEYEPNMEAVMYAYDCYRFPPQKERVDPRVIIGFVPTMLELSEVGEMYRGWRSAGAEKLLLRPNDQHINAGLPMGYEKQIFDHFQLGIKNGIIGTDYDMLHNFWAANGIADYILARAHTDPAKSFGYWENEYCSAFEAAAPDVKEYFRYWREELWNKRILPNAKKILERGRYGNFRRGLMWDIRKYYRKGDFDATDAILKKASSRKLSSPAMARLRSLQLANRHGRLLFDTLSASTDKKVERSRSLLEFRIRYRNDLNFDWGLLFSNEKKFGDITGVFSAMLFRDYSDYLALPLQWHFRMDPHAVGQKERWQKSSIESIRNSWSPIRIDSPWEKQNLRTMADDLKKRLKNYDGIGYYALSFSIPKQWKGNKVFLHFGGVDDSCQVYLNGQYAGEHVMRNPDDWKTPFPIRIDPYVDWHRPYHTVIVRVIDSTGDGGIWRPVFLVKK